jgi:hypothetical protein
VRVGASGKAKRMWERFVVDQSIIDRPSETEKEHIMRWERRRAWASAAMEKIKRRMEDLGMWVREGSEEIGSG